MTLGWGSTVLTGNRFLGVVKSFNEEKGFGFIRSDEVHSSHGQDVFLHHRQLGSFAVGSLVTFAVKVNDKGQPRAYDLTDNEKMVAFCAQQRTASNQVQVAMHNHIKQEAAQTDRGTKRLMAAGTMGKPSELWGSQATRGELG